MSRKRPLLNSGTTITIHPDGLFLPLRWWKSRRFCWAPQLGAL